MSIIDRDQLSERCFSIASCLSNPICKAFEKCTHLFLPKQNIIYPEMAKMSSFQYMAYLISTLAQSVLLFIVGVPLAIIGKICKAVAVQLSTKGFIFDILPSLKDNVVKLRSDVLVMSIKSGIYFLYF